MVIRNVELETVCGVTSTLPENTLPEFAFAGKSNVGKSSLINALMNRKALARTSSQPGKTQTINFYNINGDLYYVDLPGYGYAKVPQSEKVKWGKMIENYLHKSQMLKCVFLLVDIRHEPSANDKTMYDWVVYNGFRPVIIATKLDKIKRSQIQKQVKLIRTGLGMEKQDILIPFSAETKQGREDIWNLIDKMAAGEDLLTAEEEIQAEKAAEWAAKKAAKEAQQNLKILEVLKNGIRRRNFPAAGAVFAYNSENLPEADFKTHILTFHQGLHHISVDILTPLLPVAGHSLSLILVGDGEVEADEDRFAFPDFTVDDIVLIC